MSWQHFKQAWLIKFWAPAPAVIAAGILSTYYFGITGTFWAVTGEFTRWGGQILQLFGVHAEEWGYYKLIHLEGSPLTRIDGMMILGMFGGCFAAALWANNVKLRMPRSRVRIMQAIVGGMIAGFGARLAMGCNLAAFFTGIPQFSLHAWFFALATAIGSWFGARFTLLPMFRIPVKMQKVSAASPLTQKPDQARRRFRLGMLVFIGMIGWALLTAMDKPKLGLAMLFGVGFGLLIERAQICFTSAFRDLWISGRTHMAKAIIFGMAVSAIGIFSYVQLGVEPKIMWAGPNAVIGGLLFGFGIVLAGGCETGWMYRAGSSVVMVGCSPHTGQSGSRSGNGTARHVIASASNVISRAVSGLPTPSISFTASTACMLPITPTTAPSTPASLQLGTSPAAGISRKMQR